MIPFIFPVFLYFVLLSFKVSGAASTVNARHGQWQRSKDRIPEELPIRIEIGLKTQLAFETAAASLLKVSDPHSLEYGRHWTREQVSRTFAPRSEDSRAVMRWLHGHGVTRKRMTHAHSRGHVVIESTFRETERLLGTTCTVGGDPESGEELASCDNYTLPASVSSAVEYITVTSRHVVKRLPFRKRESPTALPRDLLGNGALLDVNCSEYTTPACLRTLYNMPFNSSGPHPSNSFGIFEQAWVTWLPEDLDLFFQLFEPSLVGRRPVVERVDGGFTQTNYTLSPFNLEPDLDFEYAMALTHPQPVQNIQVGSRYQVGNLNNLLAALDRFYCGSLDPSVDPLFPDDDPTAPDAYNHTTDCGSIATLPNVLSISYSYPEASFPKAYLKRQCLEFLKLGLMGVTVVASSGDTGTASGMAPGTCINETDPDGQAHTRFSPQWPSACPWVTSVGGTQRDGENETAWYFEVGDEGNHVLSSGGGFSRVFPIPPYQRNAVAAYTSSTMQLQGAGYIPSTQGRGFPDVSALASNYLTVVDGQLVTVQGTSAAAPVFASMIVLVNNERLRAGKTSPVGFVNPALYANPGILRDVQTGANEGCGARPAFVAGEGWDAVTGLGSPDYERLKNLLISLP
ncbi:subtilisin-like protein [Xylariaceae sp. FL1651]|nr:subtilisin-like protein [Xylariaceae sp. FL1651]